MQRLYVGGHQAVSTNDFVELALGTPVELWLGVEDESEEERAARLDAARDILAANPNLPDDVSRVAAEAIEAYAPELFNVVPLVRPAARRNRSRKGAAALTPVVSASWCRPSATSAATGSGASTSHRGATPRPACRAV